MSSSRRMFRLFVLALIATSLTACHFHRHCGGGFRGRGVWHGPVRVCR